MSKVLVHEPTAFVTLFTLRSVAMFTLNDTVTTPISTFATSIDTVTTSNNTVTTSIDTVTTSNNTVTTPINTSWQERDPMNPFFFDLGLVAEMLVNDGRKFYRTVDHVIRAYSMEKDGSLYKITYVAKETLCPIANYFNARVCLPHKDWAEMRECSVVIWDTADKAHRNVSHYKCGEWIHVDYAIPE